MSLKISFFQIVLLLFGFLQDLPAQSTSGPPISEDSADRIYGLDPMLYNGKTCSMAWPADTKGTPYFAEGDFPEGTLVLRGMAYEKVRLDMDLFNHQVILKYLNNLGAVSLLEVSHAWLDEVDWQDRRFQTVSLKDTAKEICQVIGEGKLKIAYRWQKRLVADNTYGSIGHKFTSAEKDMYLLKGNVIFKYKNNWSFIRGFSRPEQAAVRKYLRQHSLRVKTAPDNEIAELINFCSTL